jgi:hypothetical protein
MGILCPRHIPLVMALFSLLPGRLQAAQSVTLYLDGAVVEREARATAGVAEVRLPPTVDPASVRIAPRAGAAILSVERLQSRPSRKQEQGLAQLEERRKQIQDRLRALAVREEIFKRAAQAQSGKAPRKTKANPEPLATIRQGTEYAISQLESVLRLIRRADEELATVDARMADLKLEANVGGLLLKVRTDRRDAVLLLRYVQKDLSWSPRADLRLSAEGGQILLRGNFPPLPADTSLRAVPAPLNGEGAGNPMPVTASPLAVYLLTDLHQEELPGPLAAYRYRFANPLVPALLPLKVSCYRAGEYLGTATLEPTAAAGMAELLCGR